MGCGVGRGVDVAGDGTSCGREVVGVWARKGPGVWMGRAAVAIFDCDGAEGGHAGGGGVGCSAGVMLGSIHQGIHATHIDGP